MATSQLVTLALALVAQRKNLLDLADPHDFLNYPFTPRTFQNGTGAQQMDLFWRDQRTVNASTNDDIDLRGGLTDGFGVVIQPARIKLIFIENLSAAQVLTVGAGSNPFINWLGGTTPTKQVRPGGFFLDVAPDATGYPVTASTGDILRVANAAGAAATYNILLGGCSA